MAGLIKRGKNYYMVWREGDKQKRRSLATGSYQIAKEKKRKFESKIQAGRSDLLPTKTPIVQILDKYVEHIAAKKTPKSVQSDVYYLRGMFGPVCPKLEITSLKRSLKKKQSKVPGKKHPKGSQWGHALEP